MDARVALATLASWQATSPDERSAVLDELVTSLGDGWRAGRTSVGRCGLGELVHDGTGLGFAVVPGGWLRMGLSVDDLFTAARARDDLATRAVWGTWAMTARPTRWVRIRPHLLALAPLPPEGAPPAAEGAPPLVRKIAIGELDGLIPDGLRLPSEAELEWALRDGGAARWIGVAGDVVVTAGNRREVLLGELANGFGLVGLRDLQNPCADGAVDYELDTPTDQGARATDRPDRIARWAHTRWQDADQELIGMLCATRAAPDRHGDTVVRLAADLPGLTEAPTDASGHPAVEMPGPLPEHALTLAALQGDDTGAHQAALAALAHVAIGPGHDVAGTASAVLAALPMVAAAARGPLLTWLADVQVGGHGRYVGERPERKRRHELTDDRAAIRTAIAAGTEAITPFLDDTDPDVRSAAALALAFTVDAPAEAKAALARRMGRELEVGVQAGLLLALVRLGSGFRAPPPDPAVAAAIAIATAFDGPPNVAMLIAASALGRVPHLAFAGGRLGDVAISILRQQEPAVQAEAAATIALRAAAEDDAALATLACTMAFGAPSPTALPRAMEELTSDQRRVVDRLAGFERPVDWLAFGLPPTVNARRRFVGVDPPGPCDRFVPMGDVEVPLWFALRARLASEGSGAAMEACTRLLASASAGERLAIYLDRATYELWDVFEPTFDELLAAASADRDAAGVIDALVAAPAAGPRGVELVRAVLATRGPGEAPPAALLRELSPHDLGDDLDALRGFSPPTLEAHLLATLRPVLDRALASEDWQVGLERDLRRWATVLALAPSPTATRQLLLLGWASGQPAAVRKAVGAAVAGQPALAAILEEFDGLPQFKSWPRARAALPTYAA